MSQTSSPSKTRPYQLDDLIYLMARLRKPVTGCPWDLKQSYQSITPSTIEEAYEVVDAIDKQDYPHLKEELGDLVFQAIFYSQLATEDGHFNFHDIIDQLTAKLIRRHPHVFPEGTLESEANPEGMNESELAESEAKIKASWEAIKQEERDAKGSGGILDDVPLALPALSRAAKIQKRVAKVGFDWDSTADVIEKFEEELQELKEAIAEGGTESIKEEFGDLLFSCVNLSRHLKLDADQSMRHANQKFESRFRQMEALILGDGKDIASLGADTLDGYWERVKQSVE